MTQADIVGRSYPPVGPYQVGREHIRLFASATKNTHAYHHDLQAAQKAGYQDLVAPPTYLVSLAQQAEAAVVADPEADIDFARVVHADQRFTHHRPVVAGDELTATATIKSIKALGGHRMVTTEVQIVNANASDTSTGDDARRVALVTSTLLVRAEEEPSADQPAQGGN